MAGEVRAIEADRLILLAGTVVRIPLGLHVPRIPPGQQAGTAPWKL